MSDLIRIGAGTITAYDLLNTSSYLVTNWTRQTDMTASDQWQASQPDKGLRSEYVSSIELGSGNLYGLFAGTVEFFVLTELMGQYIHGTIMSDKPIATVTAYLYDDFNRHYDVFYGELVSPSLANAESEYNVFGRERYWNNQFVFRGSRKSVTVLGAQAATTVIGLQDGGVIGLETQS